MVYKHDGTIDPENPRYPSHPRNGVYRYSLRGLLVHKGEFVEDLGGAHFVCMVGDKDRNWYEMDDDKARRMYDGEYKEYFGGDGRHGGDNCVYLALYIMCGSENKYIFRHTQISSNTNNALKAKSFKEASIDRNVQPNIQTCTSNKSVQSLKCNPNTNNRMNMQPIKPQSRPRKRSMKHNAK
eukprot:922372_1